MNKKISETTKKMKIEKGSENVMRNIKIEKVVLSIGGTGDYLAKGVKLLKFLTGRKPASTRTRKRIPNYGIRPGLEVGTVVTIRKNPEETLKRMLVAIDNTLRKKQISQNNFSFGVKEYLEIPGIEYQRDIGIMGFDMTVVFKRAGRRVQLRKIKQGKISIRQVITKEEIIKYMEENFQTKFI
ncbi:MAG TPA: 50S ribosomal protein L5 [Nanoarchaeota archaeon]|nr:50S ribosomal protein L5P [uncultured archaeon]HIG95169.1 50S ribosomal protein L5 [Nanoarchaeota archaeon]HIH63409.1 50S ribosomal protein L5 [Nanoarchaeota archaeon]HIJ09828.1 50S ribosomal protein L5 [Nanoarchaeota archaeon]